MPKILGLVWDPALGNGQRIHQRYGWTDPFAGLQEGLDAINQACGDLYTMEIRETVDNQIALTRSTFASDKLMEVDGSPALYNADAWVRDWSVYGGNWNAWPNGGQLHVGHLLFVNNLVQQINDGAIDEVWLATPPIPAPFEGCMLYPEGSMSAYTTHDKKIAVPGLRRRAIIHHPQVENWNLVHNYWHRVEAVLAHIWGRHVLGYCDWDFTDLTMQDVYTYAQLFTMTDLCRRGEAQVGSCHFMPNSKIGYAGDMDDAVPSGHHLWYDYPNNFPLDLNRKDRYSIVDKNTWKGFSRFPGSVNEYVWQLDHIPRGKRRNPNVDDIAFGRWTDWWKYITNVNDEFGYGTDSPRPTINPEPPIPLPIQRYGDKYVMRIAPHDGDPDGGGVYRVFADSIETHQVTRRQREHNEISMVTQPAKVWTISGPNWSYDVVGEETPVVAQYTGDQLKAALNTLHAGALLGCPKPNRGPIVMSNGDYAMFFDGLESSAISVLFDDAKPLADVMAVYKIWYDLAMKKYCGTVVVPPVVVPPGPPVVIPPIVVPPIPPSDVVSAFARWRDAQALERKLWDEYVKLTRP